MNSDDILYEQLTQSCPKCFCMDCWFGDDGSAGCNKCGYSEDKNGIQLTPSREKSD